MLVGNDGSQGSKGDKGDTGPVGPQGPKGEDADVAELEKLKEEVVRIDSDLEAQFQGYKIYAKSGTMSISAGIGTINTGINSLNCHLAFCKKDGDTSVLAYANIDGVGKITACVIKHDGSLPTLTIGYSLILFYK